MNLEKFVFGVPLYVSCELPSDTNLKAQLDGYYSGKVDGYCTECERSTTFSMYSNRRNLGTKDDLFRALKKRRGFEKVSLECARNNNHKITVWFLFEDEAVRKVGQFPSLADIANDEARTYRQVLNKGDAAELHKAIGLAAHGVGVGSFVYLRRIFENLVYERFNEFKDAEGWVEADFSTLRMDEKVAFLKDHLPHFLFENRKLYAILSRGIHELSEEVCLKAFEPLKLSIKIILEEDKKKREELELRKLASDAIKDFEF